jgi:periplasmic protein TonB
MLNVLLESKAQHTRRVGGTLASTLIHGAIITGAVLLTVQPLHTIVHEPPPEAIGPYVVVQPQPPEPQPRERPAAHDPAPVLPEQGPPIPKIDVVPNTIAPVDPNAAPIENLRTGPALPGGPAVGPTGPVGSPTDAMDVRLVDKPPRVLRSENPRFPEALRSRGQNGRIVVQFVVDTLGRAEMNEFTVVDATDAQLADAVRAVLPRFRFTAGEAGGHKVRTMVALPFDFTLVR